MEPIQGSQLPFPSKPKPSNERKKITFNQKKAEETARKALSPKEKEDRRKKIQAEKTTVNFKEKVEHRQTFGKPVETDKGEIEDVEVLDSDVALVDENLAPGLTKGELNTIEKALHLYEKYVKFHPKHHQTAQEIRKTLKYYEGLETAPKEKKKLPRGSQYYRQDSEKTVRSQLEIGESSIRAKSKSPSWYGEDVKELERLLKTAMSQLQEEGNDDIDWGELRNKMFELRTQGKEQLGVEHIATLFISSFFYPGHVSKVKPYLPPDVYNALVAEKDGLQKGKIIENFLTKHPESKDLKKFISGLKDLTEVEILDDQFQARYPKALSKKDINKFIEMKKKEQEDWEVDQALKQIQSEGGQQA